MCSRLKKPLSIASSWCPKEKKTEFEGVSDAIIEIITENHRVWNAPRTTPMRNVVKAIPMRI